MDNNMPKLSVAENKYGELVHIRDIDEERRKKEEFTCPICSGKVKARAVTDTACVQSHFYHTEGKCGGESEGHWMFKNWLLKEGTEFFIQSKDKNEKHIVKSIELEKTYSTNFGKYRPDITVTTKEGKTILFEIRFSSRKTNDEYLLKWQELGLDVVEVDVKKLMEEDYDKENLTFDIMYSEGKSYVSTYKGRDRKLFDYKTELKRQDKLNYKARWMRLDWIYIEFKRLYSDFTEENKEKIIESFSALDTEDKEFVFESVKKHKLGDLKDKLSKILDNDLYNEIWDLYDKTALGLKEINSPLTINLKKGREYFTLKIGGDIEYKVFERKRYGKIGYLDLIDLKSIDPLYDFEYKESEIGYWLYRIDRYIKNEKEIKRLNLNLEDIKNTNTEIFQKFSKKFCIENTIFKIYFDEDCLYFSLKEEFLNNILKSGLSYENYYYLYKEYSRYGKFLSIIRPYNDICYIDFTPNIDKWEKEWLDKKIKEIFEDLEQHGLRILERAEGK